MSLLFQNIFIVVHCHSLVLIPTLISIKTRIDHLFGLNHHQHPPITPPNHTVLYRGKHLWKSFIASNYFILLIIQGTKHNFNHESYISSIYVHLSWNSIIILHTRCFGQNGRSLCLVDTVARSEMVVEELQVSDGKTCDLACWVVNYTRTPDNLVKSSAFYTRSLSVRSQMVAPVAASQPSLRDHRMIVHHTAQLKTAWTIRGIS